MANVKTINGWIVVDRHGRFWGNTFHRVRRDTIQQMEKEMSATLKTWAKIKKHFHLEIVKASIVQDWV